MRRLMVGAALTAVATMVTSAAFAAAPSPEEMAKDPLVKKYFDGPRSNASQWKEEFKFLDKVRYKCGGDLWGCSWGVEAVNGKPNPVVAQYLMDLTKVAPWGEVRTSQGTKRAVFVPKIVDSRNALLMMSATGLPLFRPAGAADALASTLKTEELHFDLYNHRRRCDAAGHALQSLWMFGKDGYKHLPLILEALARKDDAKCGRQHMERGLPPLETWTLNPEQMSKMETLCQTIWQDTEDRGGNTVAKAACIRFMGMKGSTNGDVKEFIANYAQGNDRYLRVLATRAAGQLGIKATKSNLQEQLKSQYRPRKNRVKKGKKYVEKTVEYWDARDASVPAAIALLGMGDKTAAKAIDAWLALGPEGKPASNGFKHVFAETVFASPAAQKKLMKNLNKVFATVSKKDPTHRELNYAAIALMHMGQKAGLKRVMKVLGGSDNNAIKQVLDALGSGPKPLQAFAQSTGLGRLPVGKGGFSPADAQAIMKLITKRMKFWGTTERSHGVRAIKVLRGAIDAAAL